MFYTRIIAVSTLLAASISTGAGAQSLETPSHAGYSHGHHKGKSYYGGDGVPSYLKRVGTYSRALFATGAPRNGNYFSADGVRERVTYNDYAAGPRIIHVDSRLGEKNCSYEAGVCVIRP